MLNQVIRRAYYLKHHLEAPLLKEREEYLQFLADKGLCRETIKIHAEYLLRIIQFLHLERDGMIGISAIEKAADAWAKSKHHHPFKESFSKSGGRRFVLLSIDWLKRLNRLECLPEEKISIFTRLFGRRRALQRHTSAPLLQERLLYLQHWVDLKAKDGTLRRMAQYLLLIMERLQFNVIRKVYMREIEKAAEKWAKNEKVHRWNNSYSTYSKRKFIYDAVSWFKMIGCLEVKPVPAFPFQEYRDKYLEYIKQELGLAQETVYSQSCLLRNFLTMIRCRTRTFAAMSPRTIDDVLVEKHDKDGLCRRSVQSYASVVRSFLRYAESQHWCKKGLASSIKAPRVYRHENLPYSPNWKDVQKIIVKTQTDHATDIRDYAVLLLLAVYGMRRSEVSRLKLQDIDWKNEQIFLRRAKSSKPQVFPLSRTVGEAILRYLREVRPSHCKLRELFICLRSPYHALASTTIFAIVNRRLKPLNLPIKHHGPHALRHACATHLINQGFSLKEISDHLGHQQLETTRIYTKVDLINLRKVADQNWEGIL